MKNPLDGRSFHISKGVQPPGVARALPKVGELQVGGGVGASRADGAGRPARLRLPRMASFALGVGGRQVKRRAVPVLWVRGAVKLAVPTIRRRPPVAGRLAGRRVRSAR
jgi:hypothetical protein